MGTARKRKVWDLGLEKALFPSPSTELGLRGRTMDVASPSPCISSVFIPVLLLEAHPDASQRPSWRCDAEELDQG